MAGSVDSDNILQQQAQSGLGYAYPNIIDAEGKITIIYGVRGIPEKFFIDRYCLIARKFIGPMNPELLRQILDDLLSQSS